MGEEGLLGFLDSVSGGSSGNAALPLDQVHNIERDDRNKAAEDDRHHEPQRTAVGQKLPDDESDGAGEDGDQAGVLCCLRNGKAEAVGRKRACAADAEREGVHRDQRHAQHGDEHGDQRKHDVADTGVGDDLLFRERLLICFAETMPVTAAGAYALVTAIMALEPFSASVGMASFMESAARPSSVGKIAMAAIRTAETSEARWAVFSSFADSKRETISGPERKVQK